MQDQTPDSASGIAAGPSLSERRQAFGAKMRAMRATHGMTAAALAQMTRINVNYIEAIESGALDRLPGEVFGRGFVRCIAKNLKADGGPLLQEFDGLWEKTAPRSVLKVEIKNRPVKVRSEEYSALIHNAKSLARRGAVVKVALPAAAACLLVYGLVATPLLRTLVRHMRGAPAAMAPAKTLNLRSVDDAPEAVQAAAGKESQAAADVQPEGAVQDLAVAAGVAPENDVDGAAARPKAEPASAANEGQPEERPAAAARTTAGSEQSGHTAAAPVSATTGGQSEPAKPEAPGAASAEGSSGASSAAETQTLEIVVTEPVRIKLDVDKGPQITKELTPDTYKFTFADHADMMVYDAAAVKISFNGRPLGSLGNKGRVRRLSFQAQATEAKKL